MKYLCAVLLAALPALVPGFAANSIRGHWSGNVKTPDRELGLEVDLDKAAAGWQGLVAIPVQGISGIPLSNISLEGSKVMFQVKAGPTFDATLSADGQSMNGVTAQGGQSFPFTLKRMGDPKIEAMPKNPAVAKEFVGSWEGQIEPEPGKALRLIAKINNAADGTSNAVFVSVDQGGTEIPVQEILQTGTKITLKIKLVGGQFGGEINKDGTEIKGEWSQGGGVLPLNLRKAAK